MSKVVANKVFNYPEILNTLSEATRFLAERIHSESIDSFLIIFRCVKEESLFSIVYKEMERNEAAVQEAERVVLGVWGHWNRCEEAARLYNPHKKTRIYIETIGDDLEKFYKLCFDKYWSTLGSANCNHKIGVSYLYETDLIDQILEENHQWKMCDYNIEEYESKDQVEYRLKKTSANKRQMIMYFDE